MLRRLPLFALKRLLEVIPDGTHAAIISRIANYLLCGQSLAGELGPIEGRCLCLTLSDTGNSWRFRVENGRLIPEPSGRREDVHIQASLSVFLLLATRSEDPDTLFFARRLSIEGETETGLYVRNLLDSLEFDWEAHLAAILGPGPAARVLDGLRRTGLDRSLRSAAGALRRSVVRLARHAQANSRSP